MATLIDLSLSGDLTSTHPIYPGYNNGGVGAQTSYYLYGNASNSGIRTNGNFLVNGNIYFGSSSVWLTDWLNQNVKTNASPTFVNVYATDWFRTYNNNGLYNQTYGTHFYASSTTQWNIATSSNIYLALRTGHESTIRGYLHANTDNNSGLLSSDGSWSVRVNNSEVELYHVTYADDFRPNIIYDRNNTGYYLNMDGTSNLWKLYVNAKYSYFGSSSNWDSGSLNGTNDTITNVHFQGHTDFWIGAGNTKWYTGVVSGHHDLLINTMQSSGSNTRGITFTASLSGGSVYRLGRWFANNTQATSYLQVDGSIKIGATSDYYSTPVAKLHVTGATSGEDVLAVDGVNGRLFTVTDDLSDSLFSINTVAGLPVMEVSADNSIVIGKFGVSDPGTTYANGTIKVKAKENDYGISIIGDYMAGMSFYANKDDGYYASQNARLGWVGIYQGNLWFQSAAPAQYSAPQHYFDGPVYASIIYDSDNNGYYVNPNSTSRLGTVNANELRSYGNTYLGDGNGDETHINDIVRIGATDSGDAHLFFGEGGAAGSDYGAHWYWDSGYTFTWNTRNAGSDTALFTYVTNDTAYVNWFRNFNMGGRAVNYVSQVHFDSDGPFLQRNNNRNLVVKGGGSSDVGIVGLDSAGNNRFQLYGAGSDYGFLDGTWAGWDLRKAKGGNLYMNNGGTYYLNTNSTSYLHTLNVNQNIYLDANYGSSIVGLYTSDRYQGVFAMGNSYKLALDGTSPGSLYGLAWTHTNVGGESKAGLSHQLLIMHNGYTQTAIGTGIWTSGTITTTSHGTSANWKSAYDWGNHASAGYAASGHNHDGSYLPIGGKAADSNLLDGLDLHTGRNNEVNKVVRTDANGYIQAGWINTTSGDNGTTAIARIYASQDGYIRYYTPANFRALITDGVYQPVGSYAAASHTHTPSQVGLGNVSNTAQVTTTYNSSLNSDSRNSRGVTRLYRRDSDTDYSVQTYWTGARWRLYGYEGDSNHADTHVGYADSAGSASSATTANRLDTYGIIYGDDWNNYYVNGKLIAGQAHGWSGPNGPSGAYAYGSYLSYRQEGSGQWQMFLGENSGNSTSNAYKMYIRSGWNGTWGGWQRLVDMAGDTCHISNGTTVTFKAEATAQWGSPSTAIVEIKGQSDNWAIKSYRWVTKAPNFNGSSFRLERYSQDAGWNLLGEVPINTTDWEWQGEIMWGLSDSRAKTNVVDMTNGLSKISQIRPVTFDWSPVEGVSDREGADFGFIAQELEEVVPEAVHTRADGYKTVRYEKVVPVLLQAVKEQQATINNLLSRIEALESR